MRVGRNDDFLDGQEAARTLGRAVEEGLRARITELEAKVAEAEAREVDRVAHLEEILDIAHEHGGEDGGDGGVTCVGCQRILVLADSALALSSPSPSAQALTRLVETAIEETAAERERVDAVLTHKTLGIDWACAVSQVRPLRGRRRLPGRPVRAGGGGSLSDPFGPARIGPYRCPKCGGLDTCDRDKCFTMGESVGPDSPLPREAHVVEKIRHGGERNGERTFYLVGPARATKVEAWDDLDAFLDLTLSDEPKTPAPAPEKESNEP